MEGEAGLFVLSVAGWGQLDRSSVIEAWAPSLRSLLVSPTGKETEAHSKKQV